MKPAVIISTYPDRKSITKIANRLVKDKVAACVNIIKISSVYSWENKIENAAEFLAFFKTTQKNKEKLKSIIKNTHPYMVPEIAELRIQDINLPYMRWLADSTSRRGTSKAK